jgi:transposase
MGAAWPERTWAVEGAGGLGHLLAQQLVAAGEQVVDVQPKLGARVRLLSSGTSNKNDPDDARSVAMAALRSPAATRSAPMTTSLSCGSGPAGTASCPHCAPRPPAACTPCCARSPPGGVPENITANRAAAILGAHQPADGVAAAWHDVAGEHLADLRRTGAMLAEIKKKLAAAVKASGTSLTGVFGVGPVIAPPSSATSPT